MSSIERNKFARDDSAQLSSDQSCAITIFTMKDIWSASCYGPQDAVIRQARMHGIEGLIAEVLHQNCIPLMEFEEYDDHLDAISSHHTVT